MNVDFFFFGLFWVNRFVKYSSFGVKNGPFILKFSIFMLPELLNLILETLCLWVNLKVHLSSLIIISFKKPHYFNSRATRCEEISFFPPAGHFVHDFGVDLLRGQISV